MSYRESYNLLETMSKRFRLDDNVVNKKTSTSSQKQRVGSITANNIQLDANKHALKVNELVKDIQRVGSISPKVDEVGLLKKFLARLT